MSASIYDTAQALRLAPPEDVGPVLAWLLRHQEPDGGWGDTVEPLTRDSSTLAAVLALRPYAHDAQVRSALKRAIAFLGTAAQRWSDPLPQGLPVGVEVIVASLLRQTAAAGLDVAPGGFAPLLRAGEPRMAKLRRIPPTSGLPPAFSFEAWGTEADPRWLDEIGSVATNPAAS